MKFSPLESEQITETEKYYSQPLISTQKRWVVGLLPVLFGVRVIVAPYAQQSICLSLCAGKEQGQIMFLYAVILKWLEQWEENISESELIARFPNFPIKPIFENSQWQEFQDQVLQGNNSN